jgi:hypothetical protein
MTNETRLVPDEAAAISRRSRSTKFSYCGGGKPEADAAGLDSPRREYAL